jgi:hypothetical protein
LTVRVHRENKNELCTDYIPLLFSAVCYKTNHGANYFFDLVRARVSIFGLGLAGLSLRV